MTSNILSIGKSGLFAAQAGIDTTGHNIANANVDGYSRQVVVQSTTTATNAGYGYVGNGTQISEIKRVYSDFLGRQVLTAQSNASNLDSYLTQIKQIDNMLADPTAGLSPALQSFFASVQDLSTSPTDTRQSLLSSAQSLAARFQSLNGQLANLRDGVNSEIKSSVTSINSISSQIATLNHSIVVASAGGNKAPNDLLDQRDTLIGQLSKLTSVSVIAQTDSSYDISIGNGLPLVVGNQSYQLAAMSSDTDPTRTVVGYVTGGSVSELSDEALAGGSLGGLMSFRSSSLDATQNALGRIAVTLADAVNTQHKLGIDANGDPGGDFFTEATPLVAAGARNSLSSTATTTATISNYAELTDDDYLVRYDGTNYSVTTVPGGKSSLLPASGTLTIGGVDITVSGTAVAGDEFLVRPTAEGASKFTVAISDRSQIAAAGPVTTGARVADPANGIAGNTGSGTISAGTVSTGFTSATVTPAVTMTYDDTTDPANPAFNFTMATPLPVDVTVNGTTTTYAAGAPVPYTAGATISFGNVSFQVSGKPGNGDSFTIGANVNGVGDNRNALALVALQTKNTMEASGGKAATATFQGAYASLVSDIGNKTSELEVTSTAGDNLLASTQKSAQSVSGVNLDEEAANLIRYQQAYQAAGKIMQIASQMFATLLTIGG